MAQRIEQYDLTDVAQLEFGSHLPFGGCRSCFVHSFGNLLAFVVRDVFDEVGILFWRQWLAENVEGAIWFLNGSHADLQNTV